MDITFNSTKLAKEFNDSKKLTKRYGDLMAKFIRRRMDDLRDVENLADLRKLPQVRCHELSGDRKGQLALDLKHPYRLIIVPDHNPLPLKEDGGLNWQMVFTVKIISVEDYHG